MLRYSTIESLANDWDTPNSCVLKNSFERVDKKSIDDLSFVSTVTGCTNLFSDFFKFFLYLPGILKAFFVILWLISISHLMSQKFQNSLNWDLSFISRVFSVLWSHSVKAMLTLFALTIPSCSKRITAEILEDPSYIKMWIPIEMQVCFHGRKHCLDLEGLLIPSSNSLNNGQVMDQKSSILWGQLDQVCSIDESLHQVLLFSHCVLLMNVIWWKAWKILHSLLPVLNFSYKLGAVNSRFDKSNRWTLHHLTKL